MGRPRRLLSVALLPSGELALRIDAVRRLLADPRLGDLPSHLTLAPPISLDSARAAAVPLAVSIIGIPFALQHVKLALLAIFPFGVRIRELP